MVDALPFGKCMSVVPGRRRRTESAREMLYAHLMQGMYHDFGQIFQLTRLQFLVKKTSTGNGLSLVLTDTLPGPPWLMDEFAGCGRGIVNISIQGGGESVELNHDLETDTFLLAMDGSCKVDGEHPYGEEEEYVVFEDGAWYRVSLELDWAQRSLRYEGWRETTCESHQESNAPSGDAPSVPACNTSTAIATRATSMRLAPLSLG